MNRFAAALLSIVVAGCTHESPADHDAGPSAGTTRTEVPAGSSASRPALPDETDPVARALRAAQILTLKPVHMGAAGTFEATLEGTSTGAPSATTDRKATLTLALNAAPVALLRPLAFSRLAAALGFHVVPTSVARAISAGELGALLADQPDALKFARKEARIQNDGTIDALLTASFPHVRTREVDPRSSFEARDWERASSSPSPESGESSTLVRDFVEMLVLDYLAAVALRRTVVLLPDAGAIVLDDNRDAFPPHADPAALSPLLRRLRGVARFPRGMRDALVRLSRARAAALLAPQGFETWLVSPRALIELDERRAGLLSLVEAQIAQRGEAAVLTL